jgi:hypothetical protein
MEINSYTVGLCDQVPQRGVSVGRACDGAQVVAGTHGVGARVGLGEAGTDGRVAEIEVRQRPAKAPQHLAVGHQLALDRTALGLLQHTPSIVVDEAAVVARVARVGDAHQVAVDVVAVLPRGARNC